MRINILFLVSVYETMKPISIISILIPEMDINKISSYFQRSLINVDELTIMD